ncbi:hypothetical protein Vadar_004713 [Vaccinium darrowii]|uniref:Uncharacterized protein n=1 Tax=Vaccinium darrowii TaxID=229202 RepID=A0ACB7XP03_9ERIC|nr:hypothetical protein Vadar_004713 [Vaccinium darrowii]
MAKQVYMLKGIRENTINWTTQVTVIERGFLGLTKTNNLYQKVVMVDAEGTKVEGIIFGRHIKLLRHTLKVYHTYSISNAMVRKTPTQYRVIDNDYQWFIYARTRIEENPAKILNIDCAKYNFVPLRQIQKHKNSREGIDVLFAVLFVAAPRKTKKTYVQDILVIDQGRNSIGFKLFARCNFHVQLSDSTGIVIATVFGDEAEKMFGITTNYLKQNTKQGKLSKTAAELLARGSEFVVQIRAYKCQEAASNHCLFTVNGLQHVSQIIEDAEM